MCYTHIQGLHRETASRFQRNKLTFHCRAFVVRQHFVILHSSETRQPAVPGNSTSLRQSFFFCKHLGLFGFIGQMDNKAESSLAVMEISSLLTVTHLCREAIRKTFERGGMPAFRLGTKALNRTKSGFIQVEGVDVCPCWSDRL